MPNETILFVDDEEDIRFSFVDRYEEQYKIFLADNGLTALQTLQDNPEIAVVVTDIRMPEMSGLELIEKAREINSDLGFIVVSGHGDSEDIITALRLGARNYLRKPYDFKELEEAIQKEARHYRLLREEQTRQEKEQQIDQFLESVEGMTFVLPNKLPLVSPLAFRLGRLLVSINLIEEKDRSNLVLSLIEIINNAIEHGNLGISGDEKVKLKLAGDAEYFNEIEKRAATSPFRERKVKVRVNIDSQKAEFIVEDEGVGFDVNNLPDPTDPDHLFLPSGRGIMLARAFLDSVNYREKGNVVSLLKRRTAPVS